MKKSLLAIALTACISMITPAHAFDYGYIADNYFYTYQIDNVVQKDLVKNQRKYGTGYSKAKNSTKKSNSTSNKQAQTKKTHTDHYSPSSSVTSTINNEMIASMRQSLQSQGKLNADNQQNLNYLANANLITQVKQALKSDGYEPNSVATAMAFWVVVNYGISQGQDLSTLKAHGMVSQLKDALAEDLAGMSNADKQRMAETLYWHGFLQMMVYLEAVQQNNQSAINVRVREANKGLSSMGISASNIKHGSRGLEFR
ncbi:hypothetical protein KZX29_08335 [Moraxella osloensis]|uniref:DUF6683 family protein n=1 Tax=Faucicola osloensis TaxID=34062 RepID=UPI002003345C|nr:DUF6683 family protein [Moraxella osloensis]MCK6158798.1 hypothetical protein [Moraxella osloensis]